MSPLSPARKNIVLVIADDLGYCDWGFMGSALPGAPRLGELTCRNRNANVSVASPNGQFPFDRSNADSTGVEVQTPHLDDLAAHGALFTRGEVAGVACAPSRRTMMLGKYQRHLAYLTVGGGAGDMQCAIELKGCLTDADCPMAGDHCTDVKTIPRLLRALTSEDYQTFAMGKVSFISPNTGYNVLDTQNTSHPTFGKFYCTDQCGGAACCSTCAQCEADLSAVPPLVPPEAGNSIRDMFDFIEQHAISRQDLPGGTVSQQTHPFFIWYGPQVPHQGSVADPHFLALYGSFNPTVQGHLARVSWFDAGVGAITQYLSGACTCVRNGAGIPTKQSLFESTVVIVTADQGFLLPSSKGQPTENNLRTPFIISDPRQRPPNATLAPHVFASDLAHVSDILATVLDYAGVPPAARPQYDFGRDLKPFIENPAQSPIRDVVFGEKGKNAGIVTVQPHFAKNRAGLVGVCANPVAPPLRYGHFRPCVQDADCSVGGRSEGPCLKPGTAGSNRCVNRLDRRCSTDVDCAAGLCSSNTCQHAPQLGSYKDFDGRSCAADADCLPSGVCQPVMLKAVATSTGTVRTLFDVNNDPDETTNLLFLDRDYLGPCLRSEFEQCLFHFRQGGAPFVPQIPPPSCHPVALCGPPAWCGPAFANCP